MRKPEEARGSRRPLDAVVSAVFAVMLLVPGMLLVGLTVLPMVNKPVAYDVSVWFASTWPEITTQGPAEFAAAIIRNPPIFYGVVGAVLCLVGIVLLRGARINLRPANQSHDGEAQLELSQAVQRVGTPLEGRIRFLEDATPGNIFTVRLVCQRRSGSGDDSYMECAYQDSRESRVVQDAQGASMPFRFEVPAEAPPSGAWVGNWIWTLEISREGSWFESAFELELLEAGKEGAT